MNQFERSSIVIRKGRSLIVLLALSLFIVVTASDYTANASRKRDPKYAALMEKYKRPAEIPFPKENGRSVAREQLGKMLFFDPRLSGSNAISCASCHSPAFSWGDGLPRAVGHGSKVLGRRTPTILNLAWSEAFFWDGRAESLEAQALGPIQAPGEMNLPLENLVAKVNEISGYKELFAKAYPGEPVNEKTIAKAIATYERTVLSAPAPFDEWISGKENAISESAKRGFALFNGKANCAACHSGWRFTDDSFHDIGLSGEDRGRGAILTEIDITQFAFKTPTLRDVERRGPYMHDGSEKSLEDVIEIYNQGGRVKRPSLSNEIKPLNLTSEEKRDLLEFLKSLTSQNQPVTIPALPR